jgi:hypothetical protein
MTMPRLRALIAASLLLSPSIVLASEDAPSAGSDCCPLCPADPRAPVCRIGSAELLSIAGALADRNEALLAQIDTRYRSGELGSPGAAAASAARDLAKTSLSNVYHFLHGLASDPGRVIEADEAALDGVLRGFTEPALFPIARLRRLRAGRNQVCLRYDLSELATGVTVLGGVRLSYSVKDETIEGQTRRVLSLVYRSSAVSHYEVLLTEHYSFTVSKALVEGPPTPYALFAFRDVRGGWIRRWGLHRPTAFAFWTSHADIDGPADRGSRTAGICIYVPHLRLVLPILPDIGFDDLRQLHLASPFLRVEYVRGPKRPRWLLVDDRLTFGDWASVGGPPPALRQLFPDL